MHSIGIDLGGTKAAAATFADDGSILQKETALLEKRRGDEVATLIIEQIHNLLDRARSQDTTIGAVGISIPGIYYARTGKVWAPNIPGWEAFPLRQRLASALSDQDILVTVDSDRAAYILGESWLGAARGCHDAIFVAVGTGIGAGILIDGRILRGHGDIAGATGWMALDKPFREEYVSCGCFEHHASGTGLAKVAREYLRENPDLNTELSIMKAEEITAHDVFAAYEKGDLLAKNVLDEAIGFWGMAVANYVSLFNPEKIIFGGGVFGPATQFLKQIREEARKWAQPISFTQVSIEASKLGSDAGLIGAGRLAFLAMQ